MQTMPNFYPNFALILIGLAAFGYGYNLLTKRLERSGQVRGFVSLLVAGGTAVTILASSFLIGLTPALVVLACFVASGLPMMIGSFIRYTNERAADERTARELAREALNGKPPARDR